jgi:hypothetical protein
LHVFCELPSPSPFTSSLGLSPTNNPMLIAAGAYTGSGFPGGVSASIDRAAK